MSICTGWVFHYLIFKFGDNLITPVCVTAIHLFTGSPFSVVILLMEFHTGKSLSEAFILTSTNPQYDKRLFADLPVQYMKTTSSEHGENMLCTQFFLFVLTFKTIYAYNMFSLCSELVVFMY